MTTKIDLSKLEKHIKHADNYCYWGVPLEQIVFKLRAAILFGWDDTAYELTRKLIHGFNKINPQYWD